MQHFPIFLALTGRKVVLSGGGEAAIAKLRLLLKTAANIHVFSADPAPELLKWSEYGRITLATRELQAGDLENAALFYAADENAELDARNADAAKAAGALVNIVDNLEDSEFITPAIVDRDPVTIAIGTEGAAPVLARAIKADLEERLSPNLGALTRIGKLFRPMAEKLPMGRKRRQFWMDYYLGSGPRAFEAGGAEGAAEELDSLLNTHLSTTETNGFVEFVGAGPGDPELLTLKARNALDKADVIIHDRLVTPEILELARREAILIESGKIGFGPSMAQTEIDDLIVHHASNGHHVVRLKSGDPTVFGRLDEEIEAVTAAGIEWRILPGITAASAAVAAIGQSLTKRNRNGSVRILTGHDMKGFAEHDWQTLARPGEVAAVYMGKRSARFIQGRLLMHGAQPTTPITAIENVSQTGQRIVSTDLANMAQDLANAHLGGATLTFIGLSPREAIESAENIQQKEQAL